MIAGRVASAALARDLKGSRTLVKHDRDDEI